MTPATKMTEDELIHRIRDALRRHRLDGWSLRFGISIAGAAKRCGWTPSLKQRQAMERIVDELRGAGLVDVIDHEDGGEA